MTLSEVISLIGAGYTKAEIEAMEAQDQIENPSPAAASAASADPPAAPAAPADPPAAPAAPAAPARDPELLEAIKALTAAVQHNNVVTSSQPGAVSPPDAIAEADKILTKFCNT